MSRPGRKPKDFLTPVDRWGMPVKKHKVGSEYVRPSNFPSLEEFVNKYMRMKLSMNWHHRFIYDVLTNRVIQNHNDGKFYLNVNTTFEKREYSAEKIYLSDKINKNIIIEAPRFHAKSQCISVNYPLWEIYRNPNIRIIIVSANQDIAVAFNRAIMNQLENNQKLIEDWGYLKPEVPQRWGERTLIVKRDTVEKDPTVVAIGVGGKLISRRADLIIIDDLLDIENARTKQARMKTKEWFENVLLPILEDNGRLVIAGTAWYKGDLYDELMNNSEFDVKVKLKALMYYDKKATGKPLPYSLMEYPYALKAQDIFSKEVCGRYDLGKNLMNGVLWENKWSFEKLMNKRKNMSSGSFLRQYLNEPTIDEEKVFKEAAIKKATDKGTNKLLLPTWDNSNPPHHYENYGQLITAAGLDLAISKKTTGDNTAIMVWGLNEKRERILLWGDYGKWTPDETKQKMIEVYHNFSLVKVKVENIAFQDMMRQQLAEDIPVDGFATTAGRKFNEETGIAHMAMLFEQGKVIIPSAKANKKFYDVVKQFLYELATYSYDQHAGDLLMASWFAFHALREFDDKLKDNRGFFRTPSLVTQLKNTRAAHRILILGQAPNQYDFAVSSLVYVFADVGLDREPFFEPSDKFMIFATREKKSLAYVINKITNKIIARIEGDLSALMYCNLLEKVGLFFNKAQLVIDKNGEGEAIYFEMYKRNYPKLLCMQPDSSGLPVVKEGFTITSSTLPIAVDYFKQIVDSLQIEIPDEALIKEMGELIGVDGASLNMAYGTGQRIKTLAVALWLLDNYENREKKLYNNPNKPKRIKKTLNVRYLIFNK